MFAYFSLPFPSLCSLLLLLFPSPNSPSRLFVCSREVIAQDTPANSSEVAAARALVRKMELLDVEWGYSFSNPSLRRFWSYLETVAIQYPAQNFEDLEDETRIDAAAVVSHAGFEIEAFADALPVDPVPEPKKRRAPAAKQGGGTAARAAKAKRAKKDLNSDGEESDSSEIDWDAAFDSGTLKAHTNARLKEFCEERGLRKGGVKSELVERIEGWFEEARKNGEMD